MMFLFQCPQTPMVLQEKLIAHEAAATQAFSDKLSLFLQVDSIVSSLISLKVDSYYICWGPDSQWRFDALTSM